MHSPASPRLIQEVATDQQRDLENNPSPLGPSDKWNYSLVNPDLNLDLKSPKKDCQIAQPSKTTTHF